MLVTVTLNPTIDRILEVPRLRLGDHAKGHLRSRLVAGKAINVSRALTELGAENIAAGWAGRDSLELFRNSVRGFGAQPRFTPIDGASRENITLIDPAAGTETHIRDAGPTVTDTEIDDLQDTLRQLAGPGALFAFTGSTAPGLTMHRFGVMLDACIDTGARVAVDSSGPPLREAVSHDLWLIKPNRAELEELVGRTLKSHRDVLDAARGLATRIPIVLISLGPDGAVCVHADGAIRGQCPLDTADVRSTVGCGDALLGGFLAAMTATGDIEAALRLGLAAGAVSATSEQPAMIDDARVREYAARRTTIEAIA